MTASDVPHCTHCGAVIKRAATGRWVHLDMRVVYRDPHFVAPSESALERNR